MCTYRSCRNEFLLIISVHVEKNLTLRGLRAMYSAWCKRRPCEEMSDTSSHSNERYLNTPAKMHNLKDRSRAAEKQVRIEPRL